MVLVGVLAGWLGMATEAYGQAQTVDRSADPDAAVARPIGAEPHPFTVEPGRFQLEIEPLNYRYDRHDPDRAAERVQGFEVPVLLKLGVWAHTDVQIGFDAFVWEQTDDFAAGESDRSRGFGNIELRVKHNLWGNDRGSSAFAVMPFVALPTHRHGLDSRAVQGGVMLPYAVELTDQVAVEWTPSFAAVRNSDDAAYVFEAGQVLVVNYEFIDAWTVFGEFESVVTTESGEGWAGHLGVGLTWDVHEDLALEGGVNFGVTRPADDLNFFFAIVRRF